MDSIEVRMRIVEAVLPQASRVGLIDSEIIVKTCTVLENYVLKSELSGKKSNPQPKKVTTKPRR
jgi:hypothetical protein